MSDNFKYGEETKLENVKEKERTFQEVWDIYSQSQVLR